MTAIRTRLCSGRAATTECSLDTSCEFIPPSAPATIAPRSAASRDVGAAFPPDPVAGAVATETCPAALQPSVVYPPIDLTRGYVGPIVVGFNGVVPRDYALWAGDLTTATAQAAVLAPWGPPYPAGFRAYPFAGPVFYFAAGPFTIPAGHGVQLWVVTPPAANCAPQLAGALGPGAR